LGPRQPSQVLFPSESPPCTCTSRVCIAARSGHLHQMAAGLRLQANEFIGAASQKATGLMEAVKAKLHAVREEVGSTAAAATRLTRARVAAAMSGAEAARDAALGRATAARAAAATVWGELRRRGAKACFLDSASEVSKQVQGTVTVLKATAVERLGSARKSAVGCATSSAELARAKASELRSSVRGVVGDKQLQVSAASSATGAMALGASGGATGLAAGGALGAAVGIVPAVFTFGLSIPIGAAIGSGAGLVVGTAVGGTVGAVGGGAAGYGAYSKKEEIGQCADYVKNKATETTDLVKSRAAETTDLVKSKATETAGFVKGRSTAAFGRAMEAADFTKAQAYASAGYMAEKASAAKSRLVGRSGTGGTEPAE